MATTEKTDLAKYKRAVRRDLETVTGTADVLSGAKDFDSKKLSRRTSKNKAKATIADAAKTRKFLDFMEGRYRKQRLVRIDLKKEK